MNKKTLFILTPLFLIATLHAVTIKNDLIEVTVNDFNQRLEAFKTIKGDADFPSDDAHFLLQQKAPSMNGVYLYIDGKLFKMGKDGKSVKKPVAETPTKITSEWEINRIRLTQIIEIVDGYTSLKPDSIVVSYFIHNQDSVPHELGMRLVFDTFNGPNDNMPYLVAGKGVVITEQRLTEVPDYIITLDSLLSPYAQFQATLKGKGLAPPDSLIFAHPEKIDASGWDFQPVDGNGFKKTELGLSDSAYALMWGPITFPAAAERGSKKRLATKIGLYNSSTYKGEALDLSLGAPIQFVGNTAVIIGLVQNKDLFKTVKNVKVDIELPPGSQRLSKINTSLTIPEIKPDSIKFLYYIIETSGVTPGDYTIKLSTRGEYNNSVTFSTISRKTSKKE